jgi:HPt (histidine-containing phosphotransfer) domain-containing protein
MITPLSDNSFVFNPPIDNQYVVELYAGDYTMIEETFSHILADYDDFVQKINAGYESGELGTLKAAVHKMKPLFGFVGLTSVQSQCHEFENACQSAALTALANEFSSLKNSLRQAKIIIEAEKERLARFNEG